MFEDCNQGHQLFNSTDDWFNHMQWQHTLEWSCQAPGHEDHIFHSQIHFEQHMRSHHEGSFTESQLPTLISKGARPSSHTFEVCPLCHDDLAVSNPLTSSNDPFRAATFNSVPNFRQHIAQHLDMLALLSLPERADLDENLSNERQSQSADLSTLAEKETFPPANFEDNPENILMLAISTADQAIPDTDIDWTHIQEELQGKRKPYPTLSQDSKLEPFVAQQKNLGKSY